MSLCIGLDVSSKTSVYTVKDDDGRVVETRTIDSDRRSFARLAKKYPGCDVVLESSGLTEWIYDELLSHGLKVHLVHPINILRVLGKKSDEVDAGFLVDAFRMGVLLPSYVPPQDVRALRQLVRRHAFLTQQRVRLKNRIHGILKRRGIRFETGTNPFTQKARPKLLAIGDPEIPVLLQLMDAVDAQRDATAEIVEKEAAAREGVRHLMSVPGFGALAALTIFAELGDVARFPNADSVSNYFGLVPTEYQSGETHIRGHITRRGSALARWVLVQAAWVHIRDAPKSSITAQYRRAQRRVGSKRAVVMVARKLAKISYWLLREGRDFRMIGQASYVPGGRDKPRAA